ncbi:HvfC/BufC family peptide modification chaperone [Luteibacter yeojuensis]
MNALADFHDAFAAALRGEASSFAPASQAAFAVYRNTVMRACLDALEANFPAVLCLVGRDWFRAAAAIHTMASPPKDARLARYGDDFPAFLEAFEPAAALPYLADVARLDRLYNESLDSADAEPLDMDHLLGVTPSALAATRLPIHPATRWLASSFPALSIWRPSRDCVTVCGELAWRPECTIVVRVANEVSVLPASLAELTLLEACHRGATMGEAVAAVATAHPDVSIELTVSGLLRSGAFAQP